MNFVITFSSLNAQLSWLQVRKVAAPQKVDTERWKTDGK